MIKWPVVGWLNCIERSNESIFLSIRVFTVYYKMHLPISKHKEVENISKYIVLKTLANCILKLLKHF